MEVHSPQTIDNLDTLNVRDNLVVRVNAQLIEEVYHVLLHQLYLQRKTYIALGINHVIKSEVLMQNPLIVQDPIHVILIMQYYHHCLLQIPSFAVGTIVATILQYQLEKG